MRIKSTLAKRFAVRVALAGAVLSIVAVTILVPLQRAAARKEAIAEARTLAQAVGSMYQLADKPQEIELAAKLLSKISRAPHVSYVSVLNEKGRVIYSTQKGELRKKYTLKEGVLQQLDALLITHVFPNRIEHVAGVCVAMSMPAIYAELQPFYLILGLGFCIIVAFLTLIVAWTADRVMGSRLARLAAVMQSAEKGAFLVRAEQDKPDEIGFLAGQFNRLLIALTNLQAKDIEREHELQNAQEELAMKAQLERAAHDLSESNKRLKRRVSEQELLMEAAHHLSGTLKKEAVISRLVSLVRDKLGWPDFAVFLMRETEEQGKHLYLASASGAPDVDVMKVLVFALGEGITGFVAESGAPLVIDDLAQEKRLKETSLPFLRKGSMLSVPMMYQGKAVGVMDFFCPETHAFDQEHVALLYALGAQAAVAIMNADLYEATLELAISDPLTGLMNRRAMERRIDSEITRAQRFPSTLSLLMVDVDHFKSYNDRMGHVLGDQALKQIAQCLQSSVRKVDGVARFGGEEFCVILPQTSDQAAIEVAHKLCDAVRMLGIAGSRDQPLGHMSISIGVASFPQDVIYFPDAPETLALVNAADKALYEAKHLGRNQVVALGDIVEKKT